MQVKYCSKVRKWHPERQEQQAAGTSYSLGEIKDLLNAKFSELGTRLTSFRRKT